MSAHEDIQSNQQSDQEDLEALAQCYLADSEAMQTDIRQLQELLKDSQDQVQHLLSQQAETHDRNSQAELFKHSLAEKSPISLNLDVSAVSPGLESNHGRDWHSANPTPNVMGRLPHTSNESTASATTNGSRIGQRRRSQQRTMPSSSLRRMGGRAMSVDLSNMMQRKLDVRLPNFAYFKRS